MLVLGFDTETTGLAVGTDKIIQMGAVLWDISEGKAKRKLDIMCKSDLPITPEARAVHGVSHDDLETYGFPFPEAMEALRNVASKASYIVAHNGTLFDRPMLEAQCACEGIASLTQPWIDTSCDLAFPASVQTRKLVYLAAEHGFLNPFPHDAISDALTMLKIAQVYDWGETIATSQAPIVTLVAQVSFATKELAKKLSYRWDAARKLWVKPIKAFRVGAERAAAADAGFATVVIAGG